MTRRSQSVSPGRGRAVELHQDKPALGRGVPERADLERGLNQSVTGTARPQLVDDAGENRHGVRESVAGAVPTLGRDAENHPVPLGARRASSPSSVHADKLYRHGPCVECGAPVTIPRSEIGPLTCFDCDSRRRPVLGVALLVAGLVVMALVWWAGAQ